MHPLGEYGRELALLQEADALARARDDRARLARVLARLANVFRQRADHAGAFAAGQQALALATDCGDLALPATASFFLGQVYWAIGDYGRAAELFRPNVEARDPGTGRPDGQIHSLAWLAYILSYLEQFSRGQRHGEEALRESRRMGELDTPSRYLARLSTVCLLEGRVEEAGQHARQPLDLARQPGERGFEAVALCQLGAVDVQAYPPEVAQCEARYREAVALAGALGVRPLQAHCHHGLGTLYAKIGQREQAGAELATAIDLYRTMEMTFWLPQAEAMLAVVEGR